MIREVIARIRQRISDINLVGRNKSMITIGTDRKDTESSGYGDGGANDVDSSVVDIVAGFPADAINPNLQTDKSRIYIAEKTDPDDYFGISVGEAAEEEPAIVQISDNVYIKARNRAKIVCGNVSINITSEGDLEIEASQKTEIKVGSASILMSSDGSIEIGGSAAIGGGKVVTSLDTPIHIDPITGAPIVAYFETPPGIPVRNRQVTIK